MTYQAEYGRAQLSAESIRASWKPQTAPPQFQVPTLDNVGEVIVYTDVTNTSKHVTVDVNTGVFTTTKKLKEATFLIAAQIARGTGGGTDEWGIYFESFNGVDWVIAADSTRYFTFEANADGEIRHLSYSLAVSDLPAGTQFRLKHICSDVSDNIGMLTSKPFLDAPLSAGIIVSVQTLG